MNLLIDVGNSRIKWAVSQAGKLSGYSSAEHAGQIPAELNQILQIEEPLTRVIVANVAGDNFGRLLNDWLQAHCSLEVEFIEVDPDYKGINLAYAEPEKFGVDRWLALIAARAISSTDIAVVDAGTAVTVDVLSVQGQHLGGIITPGLTLMQQSLQQKTSAIQHGVKNQLNNSTTLLGTDTTTGITSGSLCAVAGAIEHFLARVEVQTGAPLSVIISGGDAEAVRAELTIESQYVPELVLQGMQILKGV